MRIHIESKVESSFFLFSPLLSSPSLCPSASASSSPIVSLALSLQSACVLPFSLCLPFSLSASFACLTLCLCVCLHVWPRAAGRAPAKGEEIMQNGVGEEEEEGAGRAAAAAVPLLTLVPQVPLLSLTHSLSCTFLTVYPCISLHSLYSLSLSLSLSRRKMKKTKSNVFSPLSLSPHCLC